MSEQPTLGKLLSGGEQRDAIHIAIAPVVAACDLMPGQHVGLLEDGTAGNSKPLIGIVDPFLMQCPVIKGQRFYLFLYPQTITSLRHEWTHPAFVRVEREPTEKELSEFWIRIFASRISLPYDTIMEGAADYVRSKAAGGYGNYLCFGGLLEGEYVPDEFWPHYENVTGEKVDEKHRGSFFTCSC